MWQLRVVRLWGLFHGRPSGCYRSCGRSVLVCVRLWDEPNWHWVSFDGGRWTCGASLPDRPAFCHRHVHRRRERELAFSANICCWRSLLRGLRGWSCCFRRFGEWLYQSRQRPWCAVSRSYLSTRTGESNCRTHTGTYVLSLPWQLPLLLMTSIFRTAFSTPPSTSGRTKVLGREWVVAGQTAAQCVQRVVVSALAAETEAQFAIELAAAVAAGVVAVVVAAAVRAAVVAVVAILGTAAVAGW